LRHPLDDLIEDEPSRGRTSTRDIATTNLTNTHVPQTLDVVDETPKATTEAEKSTFSDLLRRFNPLAYIRDQNSGSTPATPENDGEAARLPDSSGNSGRAGSSPSIHTMTG